MSRNDRESEVRKVEQNALLLVFFTFILFVIVKYRHYVAAIIVSSIICTFLEPKGMSDYMTPQPRNAAGLSLPASSAPVSSEPSSH
jgi:hypothetical protein